MATRWGIAGCGLISFDFTNALWSLQDPKSHQVVACAARSLKSAQEFARKFDIPKAYEGYEAMAKDPNVEVVYVGTLNHTHINIVQMFLNNGKHVLCEKPLGMNVKEALQMQACAKKNKRFLMEAVWSRFQPAYLRLKEEIDKGTLGDVYQVLVEFGIKSDDDRRERKDCGGGSTIDMGVYCLNLAQWVYGEEPTKVLAGGHMNSDGVDVSVSGTLLYSKGRTASFQTQFRVWTACEAVIYGTKGKIKMKFPFWSCNKLEMPDGSEVTFPLPPGKYDFNYWNSAGLGFEANHVRECLKKGLLESPVIPHKDSKLLAELMENVRKQVGVHYDQDD